MEETVDYLEKAAAALTRAEDGLARALKGAPSRADEIQIAAAERDIARCWELLAQREQLGRDNDMTSREP